MTTTTSTVRVTIPCSSLESLLHVREDAAPAPERLALELEFTPHQLTDTLRRIADAHGYDSVLRSLADAMGPLLAARFPGAPGNEPEF